jgi:hypothetical protein
MPGKNDSPFVPLDLSQPPGICSMKHARFDLNDIIHEPSDEQLAALTEPVAAQAR